MNNNYSPGTVFESLDTLEAIAHTFLRPIARNIPSAKKLEYYFGSVSVLVSAAENILLNENMFTAIRSICSPKEMRALESFRVNALQVTICKPVAYINKDMLASELLLAKTVGKKYTNLQELTRLIKATHKSLSLHAKRAITGAQKMKAILEKE